MFGIKIISEREYNQMVSLIVDAKVLDETRMKEIRSISSDCESLRQQLNDKINELVKTCEQNSKLQRENKSLREFRRDTLEAMGQIDLAGFQLSYCIKKCDRCDNEQHDCQKYEFGSHQYCVIPKQTT